MVTCALTRQTSQKQKPERKRKMEETIFTVSVALAVLAFLFAYVATENILLQLGLPLIIIFMGIILMAFHMAWEEVVRGKEIKK